MVEKKFRSIFVYAALIIFLVLAAYLVYAIVVTHRSTVDVRNPASGVNYTYTYNRSFMLNASYLNSTDVEIPLVGNTTCYISTDATNATWTQITGTINQSSYLISLTPGATFGNVNTTVNVTRLSDRKDASINCTIGNVSTLVMMNASNLTTRIIIDSTPPNVSWNVLVSGGNYSEGTQGGLLKLNISAIDHFAGVDNTTVVFYIYNNTAVNGTFTGIQEASTGNYSRTINISLYRDGLYNISVHVNDSQFNVNNTVNLTNVAFDKTAPSVSYTCSPTSVNEGETITCACTASDATTGVSSLTYTTSPSTSSSGTFTVTCSGADYASNSQSASVSYTVSGGGGSVSQGVGRAVGRGGVLPSPPETKKEQSWNEITPGAATIMKNFDKDAGIKEISVEVNNPAQNVKITVTKYEGKPAEVSKEKEGAVYKYLQIKEENLGNKLQKARIKIQVEKSWVEGQGLTRENVALFKFTGSQWQELPTSFIEELENKYIYETDVSSFSYFAIGEKVTAKEEAPPAPPKESWLAKNLWILIIIVVIIAVVIYIIYRRKQ